MVKKKVDEIKTMSLYEKLLEIRKAVPYLKKEKKGHGYNYVGSSDVTSSLNPVINEFRVLLIPKISGHLVTPVFEKVWEANKVKQEPVEKDRVTYFTEIDMTMIWLNVDNPDEIIECPWYSQGVDIAGEKGVGKALTYAEKYFILKFFNIPTDADDPDKFQKDQLKKMPISHRQIDGLYVMIDKVSELATREVEEVINTAKAGAKIDKVKPIEELNGYEYGLMANELNGYINWYEEQEKKAAKQKG